MIASANTPTYRQQLTRRRPARSVAARHARSRRSPSAPVSTSSRTAMITAAATIASATGTPNVSIVSARPRWAPERPVVLSTPRDWPRARLRPPHGADDHQGAEPDRHHRPPVPAVELASGPHQLAEGTACRAARSRSTGPQRVTPTKRMSEEEDRDSDGADRRPVRLGLEVHHIGNGRDRAAEGAGDRVSGQRAARQARAGRPLLFHPGERFEPLRLRRRTGGAVVVARLLLAPTAEIGQPLETAGRGREGRHQHRADPQAAAVRAGPVAAHPGAALAVPEVDGRVVEGRVRARRRVDDRVRPLLVHLRVFPVGTLAASVLEDDHFARLFAQRPPRRVRLRRRSASPPSRPRAGR